MTPLTSPRTRIAALVFTVGAAASVGVWASPSSAEDTQRPHSSEAQRADLKKDLEAARTLDGQARKDAVKKIRADARDGDYGPGIERRRDRRGDHRAAFVALLPDSMQADLKKVKDADPADRKAMRADIRKKSLAGDYGEKVKKAYTILQEDRQR